jgi:hypothetical protein
MMNFPAAPAYGVYLFLLIWYSRTCDSYQNFLDRELLLTRKLLNIEINRPFAQSWFDSQIHRSYFPYVRYNGTYFMQEQPKGQRVWV